MTHANTQAVNNNFEAIKAEGGRRSQKIADILKSAFSEAVTEVKDGTTTVRPLAKDLADTAVKVVKEKGQEAYVSAKKAAQETATDEQDIITQFKLKLQAIVKAIKEALRAQPQATTETVAMIEQDTEAQTVVTVDAAADAA